MTKSHRLAVSALHTSTGAVSAIRRNRSSLSRKARSHAAIARSLDQQRGNERALQQHEHDATENVLAIEFPHTSLPQCRNLQVSKIINRRLGKLVEPGLLTALRPKVADHAA